MQEARDMGMQSCRWRRMNEERDVDVYLLPAGSLTLLDSHAWGGVSRALDHTTKRSEAYQSLKNTLSGCRAAGLDLPYVVLGNLPQLEAI
jgi:hypothetical protein